MILNSPWALALLAVLLPVLWLLHRRKRTLLLPVGNLFLWREAGEQGDRSSRARRRERTWLLALDAAILLALVLALARPAWVGAGGRAIALVVDVSLSMGALEAEGTRLDLARARGEALLDSLGWRDAVMIVEARATPRVVLHLTRERSSARDALRRLEPSGAGARLGDAVQLALSSLEPGSEVFVFSDGTKSAGLPPELDLPTVHYVSVGDSSDNLALARLTVRANVFSPFDQEIYAEVRSFSSEERSVALRVQDERGVFFETGLQIPPGESRGETIRRRFLEETVVEAAIEAKDALPLDDRAYAVVAPAAPSTVLLVTTGSPFLEAALASHPALRATVVSPEAYEKDGTPSDVVVLDRVPAGRLDGARTLAVYPPGPRDGEPRETIEVVAPGHPVLSLVDFGELELGPVSSVAASASDRVLASAGGRPVLVATVTEHGRRIGVSGDLLEGAFPLTPSFPILISNALRWLAGAEESDSPLVAGEGDVPESPGVYQVRRGGAVRRVAVAAPVDSESDIARERGPDQERGPAEARTKRQLGELHVYLLLAGILILLIERRFGRLGLAWISIAVLLLALIGLAIPIGRRPEPLVIALDASESVSKEAGQRMLQEIAAVLETESSLGPAGLVVFGRDAWIDRALAREPLRTTAPRSQVDSTGSSPEAGLRLAGAMLGGEESGRIVLGSDGNETLGDSRRMAAALRARGLAVDVIPLPVSAREDLAVLQVGAPARVRLGEPFEVAVTLAGQAGARGTIELRGELRGDDRTLARREIALRRDREVVRFTETLRSPGIHWFSALPSAAGAGAMVWASGRPRVLHVSRDGRTDFLAGLLARREYDVVSAPPSSVPDTVAALSPYDAVLFLDVPARSLRESQMAAIAEYVERTGGGFVMAGDTGSFGPGGYAGTPVEPVLPVDLRSGGGGSESVGVVLVIDKSGSMGADGEGRAKIDAAREAAIGIGSLLHPDDVLGAIAFDSAPHVLLPLRRAGGVKALGPSLDRLGARGGTVAHDALALARSWLRDAEVSRKILVLVSDGELQNEDYQRVVEMAGSGEVVLSAIGIGIGADANRERLAAIARAGGGEAVFVPRAEASPEFLAREALRLSRNQRVEREATVRLRKRHAIARGLDAETLRTISGYAATSMRTHAATILATDRDEPVVAAWQAGIGRSVAITSGSLERWDSFERLWLQAVRWAARRGEEGALHPRVVIEGGRARVLVDAYGEEGWFLNGLKARARVRFPSPRAETVEVPLRQTAPGRYEGEFELAEPGGYLLNASAATPSGDWEESVQFGFYPPASAELQAAGTDLPLLHEIARLGGGRVLKGPHELRGSRRILSARVAVWRPLTGLALLVFLAHVARRNGLGSGAA